MSNENKQVIAHIVALLHVANDFFTRSLLTDRQTLKDFEKCNDENKRASILELPMTELSKFSV